MSEPLEKKPKETRNHEAFFFEFPEIKEKFLKRYWSRVYKLGPDPDDCWKFDGSFTSNGYTSIGLNTPKESRLAPRAHRIAWVIEYNMLIPKGLCVCHRCDYKLCCNPRHLFLGTIKTNLLDMQMKQKLNIFKRKKRLRPMTRIKKLENITDL